MMAALVFCSARRHVLLRSSLITLAGGRQDAAIAASPSQRNGLIAAQVASASVVSSHVRRFHEWDSRSPGDDADLKKPGARAFADSEIAAVTDLYYNYATNVDGGVDDQGSYLCLEGVKKMLASIGDRPDERTLKRFFDTADINGDGKLHLHEFLMAADQVLGGAPARVVLVVGGPGSGKGVLCERLATHCGVVHLSSGALLRDEVRSGTPLGREVEEIMSRGELVSSATITALLRRRMRAYPGRRVLLDGFPRSLENARDFAELCGKPELALNLYCDDTILMERILNRKKENGSARADDDIETALKRLRTFHKSQKPTLDWLQESHVPVVNLDCSGNPDSVWDQLLAIGRLMRPAAQIKKADVKKVEKELADVNNVIAGQKGQRTTDDLLGNLSMSPAANS